ncbi:hypothetical protein D187_000329 [Cystobacter fuscus DSM 2262]|uniref:Uncharacterized protein n=1 Tax=Cystobacter fuscus (strain ATCC 25194 / DSM 2262 / NBRC 100088 / M29) TaxID=1242864 RepID=S9PPD3_CYSF2|nr:hypothetical protein D187_000329 [Cystobacter fuscus DSM 2262]
MVAAWDRLSSAQQVLSLLHFLSGGQGGQVLARRVNEEAVERPGEG